MSLSDARFLANAFADLFCGITLLKDAAKDFSAKLYTSDFDSIGNEDLS